MSICGGVVASGSAVIGRGAVYRGRHCLLVEVLLIGGGIVISDAVVYWVFLSVEELFIGGAIVAGAGAVHRWRRCCQWSCF